MSEMTDFLSVKDRRKARERYINPQLGITLERTIPDNNEFYIKVGFKLL